ncbi:zinc ribbon domain-containing protein [candidate division CSSED10-310 bacterium]|uniref:Zinc ribbon domain-containing protein n=1 Tax=candidate division CSSED10-310 bacterium TaxID=2855610 RepID=A0ABV6Z5J8_UNCC1
MPIYEYKCSDCDTKFEKLVFNQNTAIECPDCGGKENKKLFSAFGFKSSGKPTGGSQGSSCASCSSTSCSSCH